MNVLEFLVICMSMKNWIKHFRLGYRVEGYDRCDGQTVQFFITIYAPTISLNKVC